MIQVELMKMRLYQLQMDQQEKMDQILTKIMKVETTQVIFY